jgi:hypothetical protein
MERNIALIGWEVKAAMPLFAGLQVASHLAKTKRLGVLVFVYTPALTKARLSTLRRINKKPPRKAGVFLHLSRS